ncbi:MAG: NAD-dependent epimerase/dehydratase family protein [bacterium]|nr:NAD-dependent epimerase/dehydratase family protein [bacterium]
MILILGSNGFVGSNYSLYLDNLDIPYRGLSRSNDTKFYEKSFDCDFISQFKAVVNFVGKAHDLKNISDEEPYRKANFDYLVKSYNAFLSSDASIYIYMSSVKAVADQVRGVLTEKHSPDPKTAYGRTKLQAERYILDNLHTDKTVIILRPCMIHGPGNKGNLTLLYNIIKKGIPWPLGAYKNSRSFLSIDNLCFVIHETLNGNVPTGIYNVADDDSLSTAELVSIIAEVSQKKSRIWKVSKSIIRVVAKVGNVLPIPLNEERLEKLTENYLVTNEKIKKELDIESMPISAKVGMRKTLQSFER